MDAIVLSGVSGLVLGSFVTAFVLTNNKALKGPDKVTTKTEWADHDPWLDNKFDK